MNENIYDKLIVKEGMTMCQYWTYAAQVLFAYCLTQKQYDIDDHLKVIRTALCACDRAESALKETVVYILSKNGNIIQASDESVNLYPIYVEIDTYGDDELYQILSVKLDGGRIYIDTERGEYEVTKYDIMYTILESIEKGWLIIKQHGAGEN